MCLFFSIQDGLKHGDALPSLLFKFAFEYAINKAQENKAVLKFNETHQLLAILMMLIYWEITHEL
jgi:hypothetical protein